MNIKSQKLHFIMLVLLYQQMVILIIHFIIAKTPEILYQNGQVWKLMEHLNVDTQDLYYNN